MTHLLPPNLSRLFVSRPPLPHAPGLSGDKDIVNRTTRQQRSRHPIDGVASYLEQVKQEAADKGEATEGKEGEILTDAEFLRLQKKREEKKVKHQDSRSKAEADCEYNIQRSQQRDERQLLTCLSFRRPSDDPQKDPNAVGDPFKTLFISRLAYEATEADLEKEFGVYGPIERLRLVLDKEGKSRGYAFIIYQREKDMRTAYKDADGLKIHGRRIMVDVERGRTVKDWKPMRLGGGLGASQTTRKKKEPKVEAPPALGELNSTKREGNRDARLTVSTFPHDTSTIPPAGGFRGGFGARGGFPSRGGFRGAPARGGAFTSSRGGVTPRGYGGPLMGRGG